MAQGTRPLVAIVGRPNVGKSTLFNRLVGRHLAIVQDEPGVTRDRHYADAEVRGRPYVLVDTGGFEPRLEDEVWAGVRDQVRLAVDEADLLVFVTDGTTALTEADFEAIRLLRRAKAPVLYVANKVDGPQQALGATELYRAGAQTVIALSALHGLGMVELEAAMEARLPEAAPVAVAPELEGVPRVAVVGRPNVGKSSLINRLLGAERLLVTEMPGTTRDAIDTLVERGGERWVFVDTAGVRRKRAVTAPVELTSVMQAIRAIDRADVVVVLADITEGLADQDLRLLSMAEEHGRAIVVGLNKVDQLSAADERKAVTKAHDTLHFAPWIPLVKLSALAGRGTTRLLETTRQVYEASRRRVTTGEVNRFFEEVIARHPPPTHLGKAVRIYYITQVGTRPPRFAAMVNHAEAVEAGYQRYVQHQLRERFGFQGVPVRVMYRARRRRGDDGG